MLGSAVGHLLNTSRPVIIRFRLTIVLGGEPSSEVLSRHLASDQPRQFHRRVIQAFECFVGRFVLRTEISLAGMISSSCSGFSFIIALLAPRRQRIAVSGHTEIAGVSNSTTRAPSDCRLESR
jgi:hypothetical protein